MSAFGVRLRRFELRWARLRSVYVVLNCDECATTAFVKFATHLRWKGVLKSPQDGVLHCPADFSARAGDFWSAATIFVFFAPQTRPLQSCLSLSQRKCVVRNANRTVRSLFQLFASQISLLHRKSVLCRSDQSFAARTLKARQRDAFETGWACPNICQSKIANIANRKSEIQKAAAANGRRRRAVFVLVDHHQLGRFRLSRSL